MVSFTLLRIFSFTTFASHFLFTFKIVYISWPHYMRLFAYGICKYLLHEDVIPVSPLSQALELTELRISADVEPVVEWEPQHYGVRLAGLMPDLSWIVGAYRPDGGKSPMSRAIDALRGKRAMPATSGSTSSGGDALDWSVGEYTFSNLTYLRTYFYVLLTYLLTFYY